MTGTSRLHALCVSLGVALSVAVFCAAPASAEGEAAAAMERLLASQEQLLDRLDAIDSAAGLDLERGNLVTALEEVEASTAALHEHAAELETSEDLQAEFTPRLQDLYERRGQVLEGLEARLDPATLLAIEEILMGAP